MSLGLLLVGFLKTLAVLFQPKIFSRWPGLQEVQRTQDEESGVVDMACGASDKNKKLFSRSLQVRVLFVC